MAGQRAEQFIAAFQQDPRAAEFTHVAQHIARQRLGVAFLSSAGTARTASVVGDMTAISKPSELSVS